MKPIYLLLLLSSLAFGRASVQDQFKNEWRTRAVETLETLETHLKRHPNCELKDTVETLKNIQLFFPKDMAMTARAMAFPEIGAVKPTVFINPNWKWTQRGAVLTLIHESTHVARRKDRWLCGPDAERPSNRHLLRANPPCRLFGKTQYNTDDIDRDLEEHLSLELLLLKKPQD